MLNRLALLLSPLGLAWILFYSYTKRFTSLCHLVLGFSLGCAPMGAYLAVKGKVDGLTLLLGLGTIFWVAGFDIVYACLDYDFDARASLHSIPRFFGIKNALQISILFHLLAAFFFVLTGISGGLGPVYFAGVGLVFVLLFLEHAFISPQNLSRINLSFFTLNGAISVIFLLSTFFGIVNT
jgi:4-hydroxybenzoate polyprenyltransferase